MLKSKSKVNAKIGTHCVEFLNGIKKIQKTENSCISPMEKSMK